MACSACGVIARPGAKFCHECGARLEWVCPGCGVPVASDQRFCAECGAPLPGAATSEPPARFASPRGYTPAHLAERILKERTALEGERKQVTVLFADVSGFTSLAETLDPEAVHGLMSRAFELMLAEIHRYEGTVNQFLGDGLMALFGAPVAHEDHARRAALALGDLERAEAELRTASGFAERGGERGSEGWLRLERAQLAHRRADRSAARSELQKAMAIATELGMRPLIHRCEQSLTALG